MSDGVTETLVAEVVAVLPGKVKIAVNDIEKFAEQDKLRVGSYLEIFDNDNCILIAVIESFCLEVNEEGKRKYIVEAVPLGTVIDGIFKRGGDALAIPPKAVRAAGKKVIEQIYNTGVSSGSKFSFCHLSQDDEIEVSLNGNKFFNKHIAVVGSTGSGKSCSVARILQEAISNKKTTFDGLNNSHIIIFDIHSEYATAFPTANVVKIENLILPYWLMNSEELEDLFIDTEANDHNQRTVFKTAVTENKKENFTGDPIQKDKIHYDTPIFFDIHEAYKFVNEKNEEMIPGAGGKDKQGSLNGKLTNFLSRLETKMSDKRLSFLLGDQSKKVTFEEVLRQLIGYSDKKEANVTILDLSGVPFEALSVTVSLISRLLFEYGFYYKKKQTKCETPLLLVYEEAHKYVPRSDLARYRSARTSIERIAKEGRKYGVTLMIVSQRPSEISETIFSQCNNFVALRLTNPEDQNYVKRLVPDSSGSITNTLPTLQSGEALLTGDAIIIPSIVKISHCDPAPSSNDVEFLEAWSSPWHTVDFQKIMENWGQ